MKRQPLMNRRVRPRIDILLKANFEITGKELPETKCIITNISVSGAALLFPGLTEGCIVKGQEITLEFFIPETGRQIYAQGEIIRTKKMPDAIEAGVNFSEQLLFEEILKCCVNAKK